tara:strand:+ start:850 stop:3204 length:2355 start_codon:yes stop_codon:yes gene_type:complete
MKINRREFLSLSGKSAAGAVIFAACSIPEKELIVQSPVDMPEDLVRGIDSWYATSWSEGASGDGVLVRILEGRIKKLKGNPDHPVNRGGARSNLDFALQLHYNPDRLHKPKLRRSKDGILANTSVDEMDKYIKDATAKGKKIVVVTNPSRSSEGWISQKFAESRGGRYLTYEALDQTNLHEALFELFETDEIPHFDISHADNVLSFGADWIENWISPAQYGTAYGELRSGTRGFFAHVEPRFSLTSANSDIWMSPYPGTEGDIALSIANVIIKDKLVPENQINDFLNKLPNGKIEFGYNPEDVEKRTGVAKEKIIEVAHKISKGKSIVFAGGSTAAYTNGKFNTYAVYSLNILLGSVGKTGGIIINPEVEKEYIGGSNQSNSLEQWQEELAQWRAGYVDTVIIKGVDLAYSMPNSLDVLGALKNVETVISFGNMMNETLNASDIVVPDTTFFEEWGSEIPNPLPGYMTVSLQQPVVVKDGPGASGAVSYVDTLLNLEPSISGSNKSLVKKIFDNEYTESNSSGSVIASDKNSFMNGVQQRGGYWNKSITADQKKIRLKNTFEFENENVFSNSDSSFGEEFHLIPFTNNLGDGKYANVPLAQEAYEGITTAAWETWVEINAQQADQMGIKEGDIISLKSDSGEIRCLAYPHPAVQPGTVCVPTGQGTEKGGRYSENRGSNVLKILSGLKDEKSGSFAWASTKVSLKRAGGNKTMPKFEGDVTAFPVEPGIPVLVVKPGQTAHEAEEENHHKYQESINFRESHGDGHGHGDDHGDDHGDEKEKSSH